MRQERTRRPAPPPRCGANPNAPAVGRRPSRRCEIAPSCGALADRKTRLERSGLNDPAVALVTGVLERPGFLPDRKAPSEHTPRCPSPMRTGRAP